MSTKYDIPIRNEVINHLARAYPSDLVDMTTRDFNDLFIDIENTPDDYEFQLLAIALRCDVKILLPMLYFECATHGLQSMVNMYENLQKECQLKLILGHERLSKCAYEFGVKAFNPQKACSSTACSRSRAKLYMEYLNFNSYCPPTFPVDELLEEDSAVGNEELRALICKTCSETSTTSLAAFRTNVWKNLPDIFDLGLLGRC